MFDRILVPLDGSDYAEKALDVAITLAQKFTSNIIIVHVILTASAIVTSPEGVGSTFLIDLRKQLEETGRQILENGSKRTRAAGIPVITIEESGNAPDKILQTAEKAKADLVVIGDRGLGVVARFFLGSVADKVSHYARCPVLIVKG